MDGSKVGGGGRGDDESLLLMLSSGSCSCCCCCCCCCESLLMTDIKENDVRRDQGLIKNDVYVCVFCRVQ